MNNQDGSKKTKLRPIALLETHLKLIESVAVDQHADHIIALMQEQQVEFRVRDGAGAMINAVREFMKDDTNRVLMQGDIANAAKKTRKQAERIEKNLTGKQRDYTNWECERERYENVGRIAKRWARRQERNNDGTFQVQPCECVEGTRFFIFQQPLPENTRDHHCARSNLDIAEKAAFLANCGQGVGATWADTDDEWKTAARRRLPLWTEESKKCECGMFKDKRGDHTLACQKSPWRTRIHDRVRDSLARQLLRMGATVDLEGGAPQWSKRHRHKNGAEKTKVARIDVVATIPGSTSCDGWMSQSGHQQLRRT